jgi:hypothetical protein
MRPEHVVAAGHARQDGIGAKEWRATPHGFGAKAWHTRAHFGVRLEPSGWGGGSPTIARVNLISRVGSAL